MNHLDEFEKEKLTGWDIAFAIIVFPAAFPLFLYKVICKKISL